MQGYKLDVSSYDFHTHQEVRDDKNQFVVDPSTGEPKLEKKVLRVEPRIHLPLMLCNPNITDQERGAKGFDLFEIGVIAKKIEMAVDDFVLLDSAEYAVLLDRTKILQKFLNYKYFEMVRRIREAEKVETTVK